MNCPRAPQNGIALILVLWFIAVLTILSLGFSQTMRSDTRIIGNTVEALRARHLAEAAIARGIHGLVNQESDTEDAAIHGQPNSFELAGIEVSYRIADENGKVNINLAEVELVESLLLSQGIASDRAASIANSIADWRDENDLRRLHGAESADYQAAGMPHLPDNTPFRNIAEVQHVMGVDAALYNRIAPLITVYGDSERINPQFAPRGVLAGLPGIDQTGIEAIFDYRDAVRDGDSAPAFPDLSGVESWLTAESGSVYSIYGTVSLPSGANSARRTLVWVSAGEEKTHYILESAEYYLRPALEETDE